MASQRNSSFPLLASDQADVTRIFLELMQERNRPARGLEVKSVARPLESHDNSRDSGPPGELYDYE